MSQAIKRFYRFGDFCIDAQKRLLLRGGEAVPLAPKAFDALLVLVEHHGQVLEKGELMEMLWPDSDVEEANLPLHISAVRKALGESPNERRYILTIPGRGYRFAADVAETNDDTNVILARYTKSTVVIQDREQTAEPERRAGPFPALRSRTSRRNLILIGAAIATLTFGAVALYYLRSEGAPPRPEIRSIAILPFVNANGDPDAEYLADGIAESLINSFSQLSHLRVIARTTAFRFKGKDVEARSIGRDLRVDAIITGRVVRKGDALTVQADLLDAADGSQIWGAKYNRKLVDVFVMQEQIAREIAGNLRFKLTTEERQSLSKRYTENILAYQNYLLGWSYLHRRTRKDFLTGISYFEKAIADEPSYGLAYAALTEAYVSLTIRGFVDPAEGKRKATEAATTALSLDPNLAEAHAAIGEVHVHFAPFDFGTGDRELRRAIELSPSLAIAHQVLGASLLEQGRLDDAVDAWTKARELDPLSAIIARMLAYSYLLKRNYPRALDLYRQSRDLGQPFIILGEIEFYIQDGNLTDALAELNSVRRERNDDPLLVFSEGMAYAAQGRRAEALRIIEELEQTPGPVMSRWSWIARIYAAMNQKDLALESLERGLEAGAIPHFFKDSPVWDAIRSEQRFKDLLGRMGTPE